MLVVWLLGMLVGVAAGAGTALLLLPQAAPLAQGYSLADQWGTERPLLDR